MRTENHKQYRNVHEKVLNKVNSAIHKKGKNNQVVLSNEYKTGYK